MRVRSVFRAVGWLVSEIVPAQLLLTCLDRDHARVVAGLGVSGQPADEWLDEPLEPSPATANTSAGDQEGDGGALPPSPPPSPSDSTDGFTVGYLAAVQVIESKTKADRSLADLLDDGRLRECADYADDLARYMRHIAPK